MIEILSFLTPVFATPPLQAFGLEITVFGWILIGLSAVSIGLTIAGLLIGGPNASQNQVTQGPRLDEQRITASTYGKAINRVYGTQRLAGNIIWTAGIDEIASTEYRYDKQGSGGFFGGGVSRTHTYITTYTYYSTFIVGIARGVVPVLLRVYLNSEVVYDVTGRGSVIKAGHEILWYSGTPDQLPPRFVSIVYPGGVPASQVYGQAYSDFLVEQYPVEATRPTIDLLNDTPAYRDMAYLYLRALPLETYGGRLPIQVQVLVTTNYISQSDQIDYDSVTPDIGAPGYVIFDLTQSQYFQIWDGVAGSAYISKIDITTGVEIYKKVLADLDGVGIPVGLLTQEGAIGLAGGGLGPDGDGSQVILLGTTDERVVFIDPNTGVVIGQATELSTGINALRGMMMFNPVNNPSNYHTAVKNGRPVNLLAVAIFDPGNSRIDIIAFGTGNTDGRTLVAGPSSPGIPDAMAVDSSLTALWVIGHSLLTGGVPLLQNYRIALSSGGFSANTIASDAWDLGGTGSPLPGYLDGNTSGVEFDAFLGVTFMYLKLDGTFLVVTGMGQIGKWDPISHDFFWAFDGHLRDAAPGSGIHIDFSYFSKNAIYYNNTGGFPAVTLPLADGSIYFLNLVDGSLNDIPVQLLSQWDGSLGASRSLYNQIRGSIFIPDTNQGTNSGPTEIFVGRFTGGPALLSDIVEDQCVEAGLDLALVDTTDIAGIEVNGYNTSRRSEARNNLTQLMLAYDFGYTEIDWKLVFRKVNQPSTFTIEEKYLGAEDEIGREDTLIPKISQEIDSPLEVMVSYVDIDRDYQVGTQLATRIGEPVATVEAESTSDVALALAFKPDEASTLARKILGRMWTHRTELEGVTFPRFIGVDPIDVGTMIGSGASYATAVREATIGGGYAISLKGTNNDAAVFDVQGAAIEDLFDRPGLVTPYGTAIVVLDIPLLDDFDFEGNSGAYVVYVGVIYGGPADEFPGASGWVATDGTFAPWFTTTESLRHGNALSVLGVPVPLFTYDDVNEVTVTISSGTLDSATDHDEFVAGNQGVLGLLGKELIQAEFASLNLDGSYTLTGLIRGCRGTEWAVASHAIGEMFIPLDASVALVGRELSVDTIGSLVGFKAVTTGQRFADGGSGSVNMVGRSVRPYAPGGIAGQRLPNGDVVVRWVRRSRVTAQSGIGDGDVADISLGEVEERYEASLLTPASDITDLSDLSSWGESAVIERSGVDVAVAGSMSFTDNGDGTATITGSFDSAPFQVGAYSRTSGFGTGFSTDLMNTMAVLTAKGSGSLTLAIVGAGTDLTNAAATVEQLITYAVFTAAEVAAAGYATTDPVKVGVFQISADVGRGFPGAETIS